MLKDKTALVAINMPNSKMGLKMKLMMKYSLNCIAMYSYK